MVAKVALLVSFQRNFGVCNVFALPILNTMVPAGQTIFLYGYNKEKK